LNRKIKKLRGCGAGKTVKINSGAFASEFFELGWKDLKGGKPPPLQTIPAKIIV